MTTAYVRPDTAAFLEFLASVPGPQMFEVSPAESRVQYQGLGDVGDVTVGDLAIIKDLSIPGPDGDFPARLYDMRATRGPGPVMVFYHGGGFVIGDLKTHGPYCSEAARQLDMPVIAIDYRLAPEHPYPAAPDDCEAATRWIATSPAELGFEVTALVLAGDSAGGNMAIVTSMTLRDKPAAVPVIAQNPIYPVVADHNDWQSYRDFGDGYLLTRQAMEWFMDHYQPDYADYRAAPLGHDLVGTPPTLVMTASLDPLHDQGVAYVEALKLAGVDARHLEAEGNIHGFITLRKAIPSGHDDVTANLTALKSLLSEVMAPA
jgi:acetyl esterase